jgi:hypothetical protein
MHWQGQDPTDALSGAGSNGYIGREDPTDILAGRIQWV